VVAGLGAAECDQTAETLTRKSGKVIHDNLLILRCVSGVRGSEDQVDSIMGQQKEAEQV
jgi:hypothetical protein